MRAFEKIRELVISDWYFSGRMETISEKEKGNIIKECHWYLTGRTMQVYTYYLDLLSILMPFHNCMQYVHSYKMHCLC